MGSICPASLYVEPSLRVMAFCTPRELGQQDIAFPYQPEIKVNGREANTNLRGLKNKPGSTRRVDITDELRLNIPSYINDVEMTYGMTSKVNSGLLHVSCLITSPYFFAYFPHYSTVVGIISY